MHRFRRLLLHVLVGAVVIHVISTSARADTSRIGSLPLKPGAVGFVMVADIEAVAGNGYQPIYLTFTPLKNTFRRDRHLQIEIEPRNYSRTELDFTFRRSFTIPEASTSFSLTVYVPHYYPWESIGLRILEDGQPIETGRGSFNLGNGLRSRFAQQTTSVGILAVSDREVPDASWKVYPDVRTLVTVLGDGPLPEDAGVKRLEHVAARRLAARVQPAWVQFRPIDETNLQQHWLGYSQLDVIIAAAPLLERIESRHPRQMQHLLDWLAAGGNLWVYAANQQSASMLGGISLDPANVNAITPPGNVRGHLNLNTPNDTTELMYEPWSGVTKKSSHYSYRNDLKLMAREDVFQKLKRAGHSFAVTSPKSEIANQIRVGSFGLGTVVALMPDDPFPGSFQFWNSVVDLHEPGKTTWVDRMGIDVPRGNDNYWMWLIPSVGQPPVKSFVLLNTMFAILIGPLCYFFFRRRQRLYLLYFIAPVLAMFVTISLFAYALGADGTKTKLRSRQLTWIDSQSGYSTEQSRQTVYAVFGSGEGIQFSGNASVFPVRNTPAYNRYYHAYGRSSRAGEISVTETDQRFAASFLPARSQVQYLITEPRPSAESVDFVFDSSGENRVTNGLDYELIRLVVSDAQGKLWVAQQIQPGASVVLQSARADALEKMLGPDVIPPLGDVPMLQHNRVGWGPGTGIQVSMLEKRLESWSKRLPPKSFVAIAPLIEDRLGVSAAVVLDSVHVVMGEMP